MKSGPVSEPILKRACSYLGLERDQVLDHNWVDNGPGWFCLVLESQELVNQLKFDPNKVVEGGNEGVEDGFFGVVGPSAKGRKLFVEKGLISRNDSLDHNQAGEDNESPDFEIRAFVVEEKIEDPVTGSFK